VRYYGDYHGYHHRAAQAWQILVTAAQTQQTMTYEDLSNAMNWSSAHFVNHVLSPIWLACEKYGLPRLNDLVVSQQDGRPSYRRDVHHPDHAAQTIFDIGRRVWKLAGSSPRW
jgi:hypothetical protein